MRRPDETLRSLHLLGVAGTGMGAFAGLLKAAGYAVRGSDENVYPPMSDKLRDWGIEVRTPYAPENLDPPVDLVVVGNVIRKVNPEATAMRERGLPHASFPETFARLFLEGRHSVVVSGTHGKTTTSALLAHVLLSAGRDPGFLIGGIPLGFDESFRVGGAGAAVPVVVEGDEYDTAYFDKGPKFLHYQPRSLLLTSLEFDHADIYDSIDAIRARFVQLLALVPAGGHIVAAAGAPQLDRALAEARLKAPVERYGEGGAWQAHDVVEDRQGTTLRVTHRGQAVGVFRTRLSGAHNVMNALGAVAIARGLGLSVEDIAAGLASFRGVKRRLEERGEEDGVLVVDDFAHHPTAVRLTVEGARRRYAGRPLWALFEPRSATSCRRVFQDDYARAFDGADRVLLAPVGRKELSEDEALDVNALVSAIAARGPKAEAAPSIDAMVARVRDEAPPGSVILAMSNGAFGGVHEKMLRALKERAGR